MEVKKEELVAFLVVSECVRVAQKTVEYFLVSQIHTKCRSVKALVAEFMAVLLNQLPVAFKHLVFMAFTVKGIHDLGSDTVDGMPQVLNNVESIKHDFNAASNLSRIAHKVISNDSLFSSVKNGNDEVGVKILSNKAHLALLEGILVPRHHFRQGV